MADLDSEYLATRKATDDWQAATLTQLSTGTEGAGTLEQPATALSVDANTAPGNDAAMNDGKRVTDLKLAKPPGPNTPGEPVQAEAIAPAQSAGEAQPFDPSVMHGDQSQGKFMVTDPRINDGKPTPFDSLKDAQAAAKTPEPLAKIEETVGVSPLADVIKTSEQKDAAKNFVDLLNIPVEHLAGFITKGDVTQTATPEELGNQILSPVASKLSEMLDEKQMGMLASAVGILGMVVIDPLNPALSIAGAAKTVGKSSKLAVEPKNLDKKRFKTVTEDVKGTAKSYEERNFPVRAKVRVEWSNPKDSIDDEMDGLNVGHILRRAADNWEGADRIQITGVLPPKDSKLKEAFNIIKSERGSFQPVPGGETPKPEPIKPELPAVSPHAEEFKQRAEDFGFKIDGFLDELTKQRRGPVLSDVKVQELADSSPLTMAGLLELPPGTILNPEHTVKAKQLFKAGAKRMRGAAQAVKDSAGDPESIAEMFRSLGEMGTAVTKIAGLYAETGRTTRLLNKDLPQAAAAEAMKRDPQFRIADPLINQLAEMFTKAEQASKINPGGMTADKMADMILALKTDEELAVFAKAASKPGWWDMFTEVWINGLLSGPVTHTTNILSNTATLLWNIPERAIASGLSRGAIRPGEAQAMLGGVVESMGDAWRLAWKAFQEDASQFGVGKIETPRKAITADALELTGTAGRAVDFLGNAIRMPGRILLAGDDFFKSIAFRAELRALAKREAFKEVNEAGLTGKEAVTQANAIEARILADPPTHIHDAAMEFAAYTTFTRELGETGQKVQALASTPVGRLILPFVRTPTNIFKFAGERTPLALASRAVRDEIAAGGERRALALAKISMGAMTMGYIATLAANGYVTGNGPKDPALREIKKATGWQPNSFKIGDTYVSYSRLEPIGSLFGMAADATDLIGQLDEMDGEELASALTVAFARNASSKTFVKGMAETLHALTSQDVNVVNNYLEKELPTLIPFSSLLKQSRNVLDPVMRDVDTILDAFKNKVPGFSTDLPPHRNLWGHPVVMEGGLGPDFLSPLYTSSVKPDPVSEEIARLQLPIRKPAKSIDGVQLSPQEYDAYVQLSGGKPIIHGMTLKEKLADLIASPLYERSSDGPDGGKSTLVRQIVMDYRDRAKMILQRPDLSQEYLGQDFPELRESLDAARQTQRQKFNAPMTAPGGLTR